MVIRDQLAQVVVAGEGRVELGPAVGGVDGLLGRGRAAGPCLSGKTRKIVPSAMPAASAICRVVTSSTVLASSSGTGRVDDGGAALVGAASAAARSDHPHKHK